MNTVARVRFEWKQGALNDAMDGSMGGACAVLRLPFTYFIVRIL